MKRKEKPELILDITYMQLFEEGKLKPLVFKSYPLGRVEEAFRSLQQGNSILLRMSNAIVDSRIHWESNTIN